MKYIFEENSAHNANFIFHLRPFGLMVKSKMRFNKVLVIKRPFKRNITITIINIIIITIQ